MLIYINDHVTEYKINTQKSVTSYVQIINVLKRKPVKQYLSQQKRQTGMGRGLQIFIKKLKKHTR